LKNSKKDLSVDVDVVDGELATDKKITSVESLNDITVDFGTAVDELNLPSRVEVTLDDNSKVNLPVVWDTTNYNGDIAKTYTLTGIFTLAEQIANTDNFKASVKVIVAEKLVIDIRNISVTNATTVEVTMDEIEDVTFAWNDEDQITGEYADGKYTITVPNITQITNTLIVSADGYSDNMTEYTIPVGFYENLKVIGDEAELETAIKDQQDGETWVIKDGVYNHII